MTKIKVKCFGCKKIFYREIKDINRTKKSNYKLYCNVRCRIKTKNKLVVIECSTCNKKIKRYKREIKKSITKRFICHECRGTLSLICPICNNNFVRNKFEIRKYKTHYCSKKCSYKGHMKDWNDLSRNMLKYHYKAIYGKLVCNRCGYNKEYNITIHHKKYVINNGDNNPKNLEPLCKNCHGEEHYKIKDKE